MKTEHEFAAALKKMMATMPLEDISVISLSESIGVSRKTFYYHFHDIYDLLTLVFLDEKVTTNTSWISTNRDLITAIYNYYVKNALFIDATINSAGKDLFQEFMFNFCYQIIFNNFILSNTNSEKLQLNDRKNIARFYAYAYSNTIVYYLSTHKTKNLEGMKKSFAFLNDNVFVESINSLIIGK